jgi:hypothetical protein
MAFDVTLKNTSKTQNVGSADLYAPANISLAAGSTTISGGGATAQVTTYPQAPSILPGESSSRSLISLRNLTVPGGASVIVHVSASVTGTGVSSWYSIVKQANQFNPGSLDTSNAFTLQGSNPTFTVSTCTLQFVAQPANPWQKNTTISPPVAVAVFAGTTRVAVGGTPDLSVAAGSDGATSDFSFGSATYNSSTLSWSWPAAEPNSTAPSGSYNLTATLGSMTATSDSDSTASGNQPFQVTDSICPAGQICPPVESNPDPNAEGSGAVGINNTLPGPVTLDFGYDLTTKCDPWPNRAFYVDSAGNTVYFPDVTLNYNWGQKMLQVTYLVRNSEWVLTSPSQGNQDVEICVGARHQVRTHENGDPATNPSAVPFAGKYGAAKWNNGDKLFYGVINSVSNPTKVRSDPVICGRGTVSLPTGPGGISETWRSWTVCIPYDWDIHLGG